MKGMRAVRVWPKAPGRCRACLCSGGAGAATRTECDTQMDVYVGISGATTPASSCTSCRHDQILSSARDGVLLFALSICISVLGCEGLVLRLGLGSSPSTAWSAESRSPDGKMVATARAEETSGIGTGDPGTSVYLNWTTGSQPPTTILFLVPRQPGIIKVGMNWLDRTHLELTYNGHAIVDFEAVKCHSVDISVREIPMPNAGTANR